MQYSNLAVILYRCIVNTRGSEQCPANSHWCPYYKHTYLIICRPLKCYKFDHPRALAPFALVALVANFFLVTSQHFVINVQKIIIVRDDTCMLRKLLKN